METAGGVPEGIDEVEATLGLFLGEAHFEGGEGVQGGGGGEEVGHRRAWHGDKAALRMQSIAQPAADLGIDGQVQVVEQHHGAGGGVSGANGEVGMIVPRVVGCFEVLEALQDAQRFGREFAEILIRSKRKEGAVGGAVFAVGIVVPAPTRFAEIFQPMQ